MKKLNFAYAAVVMAIAFGQQAMASDGTINFTGKVTDVTCVVSTNDTQGTAIVLLPTVGVNAFNNEAEKTAGATPFTISLSDCGNASGGDISGAKNVAVYFEQGGTINTSGRLNNTAADGAKNVDIALYLASNDKDPLDLREIPGDGYTTIEDGGTTAKMDFLAKYYSTSTAVEAGDVTSNVTYSIVYP